MLQVGKGARVLKQVGAIGIVAIGAMVGLPTPAAAYAGPDHVVIGVDHSDPANQDFAHGRVFEYTDFFSRSVTVTRGETIDFRTAPGAFHIVGLATSVDAAREAYPFALNDEDGAVSSGKPAVVFGPSNYPILHGNTNGDLSGVDFTRPGGPSHCGIPYPVFSPTGQLIQPPTPPCHFRGGHDIEVAGPNLNFGPTGPLPADWNITINAVPGTYHYLCFVHPHMQGTVKVVERGEDVTTQDQINDRSSDQFKDSRAQAVSAEKAANHVSFTADDPGERTYHFTVGISAAGNHVAIDEMFPNPATLGHTFTLREHDRVDFHWRDGHNLHSVFMPNIPKPGGGFQDISPFGLDCGGGVYDPNFTPPPCTESKTGPESVPEVIADPGNAPPGSALTSPTAGLDAGVRVGTDYGLGGSEFWSARATESTGAGGYSFHCTIHDWMVGTFAVAN